MIFPCRKCGKNNRVPVSRYGDLARCGSCGAQIVTAGQPLEVDAAEFHSIIKGAGVPVFVDFWAAWCGPCKMAGPQVQKLAEEMGPKAIVLKVNTERHPELAAEFGVSGIPHFAVIKSGQVVFQQAGLVNHQQMQRWVEAAR